MTKIDDIHETLTRVATLQETDSERLGEVHAAVYGTDGPGPGLKERLGLLEQTVSRRTKLAVATITAIGALSSGAWVVF